MKARITATETVPTHDGASLDCHVWQSQTGRIHNALLMLADSNNDDGWASALVHQLDMPNAVAMAPVLHEIELADSPTIIQALIDHICSRHDLSPADILLIGKGSGASRAALFAHDCAPLLRGMILDTPRFASLGFAERRTMHRVVADATAIITPTLILSANHRFDRDHGAQQRLHDQFGSLLKDIAPAAEALVLPTIRGFIARCFATARPVIPNLLDADRHGHTAAEFERLSQPPGPWSPRGLYWRGVRSGLKLAGRFSDGIRLGHEVGFDSGAMLDYVYRNEAKGMGPIGRMIDRNYIDAIGWQGIRQRKLNLEAMLLEANRRLSDTGEDIRLLDIAAGHGRYILDAVNQFDQRPSRVQLRDFDAHNVADGQVLIRDKALAVIAGFERGDAFDAEALASLNSPDSLATLSVVSGLYELFPENEPVQRSLAGLAEATASGGYLVYTGQPWHPQLEFIARALTSHRDGQAWTMRRRTQAEMDQFVTAAGFEKVTQRVDPWGIFTVSLAVRR